MIEAKKTFTYTFGISQEAVDILACGNINVISKFQYYDALPKYASPQIIYLLKHHILNGHRVNTISYIDSNSRIPGSSVFCCGDHNIILLKKKGYSKFLLYFDLGFELRSLISDKLISERGFNADNAMIHWVFHWPLALFIRARRKALVMHESVGVIRYSRIQYMPSLVLYVCFRLFYKQKGTKIFLAGRSAGFGKYEKLIPVKPVVAYMPIHIEPQGTFLSSTRDECSQLKGDIMVCINGSRIKGIEYFIRQLPQLLERYKVTVVGISENDLRKLVGARKLDGANSLNVIKSLQNANFIQLLNQHKLTLYYSKIDCCPGVVLESRALGIPVITRPLGDLKYLFEYDELVYFSNSFFYNNEMLFELVERALNSPRIAYIPRLLSRDAGSYIDAVYSVWDKG